MHGVSYAALLAANRLLGDCLPAAHLSGFRQWLAAHTQTAVRDVRTDVKVNVFWQQLLDAFKLGVFGHGGEVRRFFRAHRRGVALHPPDAPNQVSSDDRPWLRDWVSWELFFDFSAITEMLSQHLSRQRMVIPLSRADLRDQMSKYDYWIAGDHRQRFGANSTPARCWGIRLDKHPMGYQAVPDDVLDKSRAESGLAGWTDPRLGELYLIVEQVTKEREEEG